MSLQGGLCKVVAERLFLQAGLCKVVSARWYVPSGMCKVVSASWSLLGGGIIPGGLQIVVKDLPLLCAVGVILRGGHGPVTPVIRSNSAKLTFHFSTSLLGGHDGNNNCHGTRTANRTDTKTQRSPLHTRANGSSARPQHAIGRRVARPNTSSTTPPCQLVSTGSLPRHVWDKRASQTARV